MLCVGAVPSTQFDSIAMILSPISIQQIIGSIDGLRDIHSGRRIGQKFTANNTRSAKKKVSMCGEQKALPRM